MGRASDELRTTMEGIEVGDELMAEGIQLGQTNMTWRRKEGDQEGPCWHWNTQGS